MVLYTVEDLCRLTIVVPKTYLNILLWPDICLHQITYLDLFQIEWLKLAFFYVTNATSLKQLIISSNNIYNKVYGYKYRTIVNLILFNLIHC